MMLFVTDLILDLPVQGGNKVRISVTLYAASTRTHFYLDQYNSEEQLISAIASLNQTKGVGNLKYAFSALKNQVFVPDRGDRKEVINIIILVTRSRLYGSDTAVRQILKAMGHIHVIGVGVGDDDREMRTIVSDPPSDNLFTVTSFEELTGIKPRILQLMCNGKLLSWKCPHSKICNVINLISTVLMKV